MKVQTNFQAHNNKTFKFNNNFGLYFLNFDSVPCQNKIFAEALKKDFLAVSDYRFIIR